MTNDTCTDGTDRAGPFYYTGEEGFEAWGFVFPSGYTVLEWVPNSVPEDSTELDHYHQSIYHSVEDFQRICTGNVDWGVSPDDFDRFRQTGGEW